MAKVGVFKANAPHEVFSSDERVAHVRADTLRKQVVVCVGGYRVRLTGKQLRHSLSRGRKSWFDESPLKMRPSIQEGRFIIEIEVESQGINVMAIVDQLESCKFTHDAECAIRVLRGEQP
jgi:hypothetical protein